MKLGIAYNAACCSELIEYSIDQILPFADVVTVVYQETSNRGNRLDARHVKKYTDLYAKGKIDSLYLFEPNLTRNTKQNETHKRNIGMKFCRDKDCDIFLSLDEDELFDKDQFELSLKVFSEGCYDVSVCELVTYYRHPTVRLAQRESYYMSMFVNMKTTGYFKTGMGWPLKVDPSRKAPYNSMKKFTAEELLMHHFSYVRTDIREKLRNQSASVNFDDRIEEIAEYWERFNIDSRGVDVGEHKAYFGGSQKRYLQAVKCENKFNIQL